MAKQNTSSDEETGEGTEAPKSGKKKLIMIISGVVILAGLGGGGWFFLKKPASSEQATAVKKQASFIEMKDMMIGMSSGGQQDRQPIMKIKVVLEVADAKVGDEIKPLLPRIEDAFQIYMRELRPADLDGSAGIYRLKEELLRRVNITIHPAKVEAVLFKEILVQ